MSVFIRHGVKWRYLSATESSAALSSRGGPTPQSRVLVLLSKIDVGLTDRHVIGNNSHARCVNRMWFDLIILFFGGID